jgi:UDP-2-acetamido-2,6-beta-L-arabino-hexul-4-ose reductase
MGWMKTVKIGVTGGEGFLGSAFIRSLKYKHDVEVSTCKREYWSDDEQLQNWVKSLDVLVHLAGKNRSNEPEEITSVNIGLTSQLIEALERTKSKPRVIFSSSIQEHRDNVYGESKRLARELWCQWSERNRADFVGLLIPNLFGPFGKPYYNSVVATFCHQIIIGENPKINIDAELPLIYVDECVDQIIHWVFREEGFNMNHTIEHSFNVKVSDILGQLKFFKEKYVGSGEMPALDSKWELYLFATFQSFLPLDNFFPFSLKLNTDQRGSFVEIIRLSSGGQVSFSTTVPEIVRGNHFHTRKMERFAVIKGKAKIAMRKVDEIGVKEFFLDGKSPSFVDMPVWHTHLIQNIGDEELLTMFWINEHYNANDPDTYFVNVY